MNIYNRVRDHLSKYSRSLFFVVIFSMFLISSLVLISYFSGIPIMIFTRDPAAIAELPYYTGYFSQIGDIFWILSSGIALFTASIEGHRFRKYLLFSGLFALFLGVDDIFMLHDGVFTHLGIPEVILYVFYITLSVIFFFNFYKTLKETPFILLFLTFFCFSLSAMDDLISIPGIHPYIFEDGFKMMGIISWMVYHISLGRRVLISKEKYELKDSAL